MAADLIISGGPIFTGTGEDPEAVAIRSGLISAIGTVREVRTEQNSRTEFYDLEGRTLTPGFIDAHVHPLTGGLKLLRCSLSDTGGAEGCLQAIADYDKAHPDRDWIWGGGWSLAWFPRGTPDAASLDAVTGERPTLLYNADGHGAWVNSAALRLAGINAASADPPDGRIERLPDGTPQGTLHEGAMSLVERLVPEVTAADWEQALHRGLRYLQSFGVTGWQDADVRPEHHRAYLSIAGREELRATVVGASWWDRRQGLEQIEGLVGRRAGMAPGYRATAVKLMLDGIAENFTAAMLNSYLDDGGLPSGNYGIEFIGADELVEIVPILDRFGFHCHFHAIGDRAVRNALDAVAAARQANPVSRGRHHIAHVQVVDPADLTRFGALEVAANIQPLWAAHETQMDDLTLPFLSSSTAAHQYPFASLMRSGARLAMGSDWSVSTPDVMRQIEVAVTRRPTDDRNQPPFLPKESLTVDQALRACTAGSAWVNGLEHRVGTIAMGKRADLVVLAEDPRTAAPIGDIKVESTISAGEVVYTLT
jgi:predicted amidohydrolase YtcJ